MSPSAQPPGPAPAEATLAETLRRHGRERPEATWLEDGITGDMWTFEAFDRLVDQACGLYADCGLRAGDVVSAVIANRLEYLVLYFASLRYGSTFNPFPSSLGAADIARNLHFVGPRLVVAQAKHHSALEADGPKADYLEVEDQLEGGGFLDRLADYPTGGRSTPPAAPAAPACIYYSSGTTGNPKGIVYTHGNMMALIASIVRGFGWGTDHRHFVFLPLGHTASINYSVLPAMFSGGGIALHDSFWKVRRRFWQLLAKHRASYVEVVPTVLFSMLNTPYPEYDRASVARLQYVGCGSAPLPVEVQERFAERFDIPVANLYGLSETGPSHFDDPTEAGWRPGSIGRPLDVNEAAVLDPEGKLLPAGEVGEIALRGPNVFAGYWKNDEAYRETFVGDWFFTGDLGFADADGRYFFSERRKDLIIKGGVNIFPGEIDEVLFGHPDIVEAATVGIADDYLGERIKSFVVARSGIAVDETALKEFCIEQLGTFKCPDAFAVVDDIPKGPSGKLLRRVLIEREGADG